jgi:hypothetical protein
MGLPWRARGGGAARPPSRAATAAPFRLPMVRGTGGLSDRGVERRPAAVYEVGGRQIRKHLQLLDSGGGRG